MNMATVFLNRAAVLSAAEFSFVQPVNTGRAISNARAAVVVVLIPPPVEAGEAPTIISRLLNSLEPSRKRDRSKELNPAVRIVTD